MSKLTWAEDQTKRVGAEVRRLRGKRTGQWLSDETERLGHALSRTTISELENGKRKDISVAEITVLARALAVSPLQLIYPDLAHGPVDVLPGRTVSSAEAMLWFSGESRLPDDPGSFGPDTKPMQWTRHLYGYVMRAKQALFGLQSLDTMPGEVTPELRDASSDRLERSLSDLSDWVGWMAEEGFIVDRQLIDSFMSSARDETHDGG